MPASSYRESLLKDLRDPQEAIAYLKANLKWSEWPTILQAVRDVEEAYREKGGHGASKR